jgi:hypothetical protein
MEATEGTLLTCDETMKVFILELAKSQYNLNGVQIILKDLDETNLLVRPEFARSIMNEVAKHMEKNIWDPDVEGQSK